jgi:hypothetical protein
VLTVLIGPDNHASHFEEAAVAFQPGAGLQDPAEFVDHGAQKADLSQQSSRMEAGHVGEKEKAEEMYVEKV